MKFKITLIATREYEVIPENYNTNITKEMLKIDQQCVENDLDLFMDNADINIEIEEIK